MAAKLSAAKLSADVAIVGAGNAALCAALAAAENGADVVVLEVAPEAERGGNSAYTAGAMRVTYDGAADLKKLIPDLSDENIATTDFGSYSFDDYFDDMARVTQYRADPDLTEILIGRGFETLQWMRGQGVRFQPSYGRQAFKHGERFKFWGGLAVEAWGGGPGLVQALFDGAAKAGVRLVYEARARELVLDSGRVAGVRATLRGGEVLDVEAGAVVLASGGFESNAEMRTRYLGPGWDLAKVRGTRHNMGDGIKMALEAGAEPFGNWSGCHAVGWDMNAPPYGDLAVGDGFQKHSYPFGIMVNAAGERFLDEGADFRNYTYAKYGREILAQPGQFAWQIFDAKVTHLLRDEYRIREVSRVTAASIAELAAKLEGVDGGGLERTVAAFNAAVQGDIPFDPNVKDGRGTAGLEIAKSNWANPLDTPPFEAYGVTCGITFTFGGLHIDGTGRVLDVAAQPIPGLYAAGELVGGLFYFNYPGGIGLTSGAVFGRLAGGAAAAYTEKK
ncbi:MAG: FAD-dependent tricarballylate dehydrogenase TcuA [Alphaproteobacteria bacterium]|jgi:tricarballylate dehydrogenase|nr:FAD-dependent tricarballylate dehydrogenase TcuA [Alphaproteobacteria bacterium]MDP6590812.1 FAD-dependent tricarballylate dehydrogenase TcuA [Alphaproteobacteria bacterium]